MPDTFHDRLMSLCGPESALATGNPVRSAAMMDSLAECLGRTAARVARGNPDAMDTLLHGAEARALDAAMEFAPLCAMGQKR